MCKWTAGWEDYFVEPLQLGRQISIIQEALEKIDDERLKGVHDVGFSLLFIDPVQVSLLVYLHRMADKVVLASQIQREITKGLHPPPQKFTASESGIRQL